MAVIMHMASSKRVMDKFTVPLYLRVVGWVATAVMLAVSIGMFVRDVEVTFYCADCMRCFILFSSTAGPSPLGRMQSTQVRISCAIGLAETIMIGMLGR